MRSKGKYIYELTGTALGAVAGWSYWYFVGCASGTCAITSRPLNSTLYGALMGLLLFSSFSSRKKHDLNHNKKQ